MMKGTKKPKVLAALSGGVDSSVAAALLKEAGYDVCGVTMRIGAPRVDDPSRCGGFYATDDAERICDQLEIPHLFVDYAERMEEKVIERFVAEYRRGRTPNPCVDCNRFLKFGGLLEHAGALGFDYLATGHYACIEKRGVDFVLKRPKDKRKDQTYFLYAVPRTILGSILFPLASLTKDEVRGTANRLDLHVAEKAESQDICFIANNRYGTFLSERFAGIMPGPITDSTGKKLGNHKGIVYYTIGQRAGLGISAKHPLYVVSIDVENNRIVVGSKENLMAKGLIAGNLNMLVDDWPSRVYAKIRYRKKEARCEAVIEGGKLKLMFEEDQDAVTPGQSVVLYDGDVVLGGGVIEDALR
jgi:tRNA-specific 2-thiouridylase